MELNTVSREKLASMIGISEDTVRGWTDRHFERGLHYTVIGKTTLYYLEEVGEWLESQRASKKEAQGSASISHGKVAGTKRLLLAR